MAKGLTKRQQMILQYILDYVQRDGYPPSIREIGADFGIKSLRGVTVHLDALARKGYITRSNTPRSIRLALSASPCLAKRFCTSSSSLALSRTIAHG